MQSLLSLLNRLKHKLTIYPFHNKWPSDFVTKFKSRKLTKHGQGVHGRTRSVHSYTWEHIKTHHVSCQEKNKKPNKKQSPKPSITNSLCLGDRSGTTPAGFWADLPLKTLTPRPALPCPRTHQETASVRATISGSFLPVRLLCTCTPVSWPCGLCHARPRRPRPSASRSSRAPGPGPRARSMSRADPETRQKAKLRRPGPAHGGQAPPKDPETTPVSPQGSALFRKRTLWSLAVNPAMCGSRVA